MTDDKWIQFGFKLIRVRDVDYFEVYGVEGEKCVITCGYHVGVSYLEIQEDFSNVESMEDRFNTIKEIVGAA